MERMAAALAGSFRSGLPAGKTRRPSNRDATNPTPGGMRDELLRQEARRNPATADNLRSIQSSADRAQPDPYAGRLQGLGILSRHRSAFPQRIPLFPTAAGAVDRLEGCRGSAQDKIFPGKELRMGICKECRTAQVSFPEGGKRLPASI